MPITSIEQTGHIILDNCVLSMLTDFCCENNAALAPRQLLDESQHWLTDQLAILQSFAVDKRLHTTDLVSAEYRPEFGGLGGKGLPPTLIRNMAAAICGLLNTLVVDREVYSALRSLPYIDRRLADPRIGLSDPDLSLVRLALDLTDQGHHVVLLTNDQDLLQFVSWARTQTALRTPSCDPTLIEGQNCLAYLDLIHRTCLISSEQMRHMISFAIKDTVKRMTGNNGNPLSPAKGRRIVDQVTRINENFSRSIEIKVQNRMVAQ